MKSRRLYYGWVMVGVLALTETISYGVLFYAFTVFIKPMQGELGWTTGQITGAYSLSTLVMALAGIPLGRALDRYGARWMMSVGSALAALLVLGWGQVATLEAFYLLWIGLGLAKAMVLYEPAFWVVAAWFNRRRRLALTALTFIAGFSSLIFTPLAQALVSGIGWRETLMVYSLLLAAVTLPLHLLFIRRRPSDLGLSIDGEALPTATTAPAAPARGLSVNEALRQPGFWWLTAAFTFNGISLSAIIIHLVPYLTESGYEPAFAAMIYGLMGAISLPGRLILTPLGDRVSPTMLATGMFITQALGLAALLGAGSSALIWVFLLLFAAGYGAITPARAALVAELFGARHYGSISSVLALVVTLVSALSPVAVGALHDALGSYQVPLAGLVVFASLAALMVYLASRAGRPETAAAAPHAAGD